MPNYTFKCVECGEIEDFTFLIKEHDKYSAQVHCICGGDIVQLLEKSQDVFMRTAFPKGTMHEHISDDPIKLRDKKHFEDVCAQNGWTSHFYDGI